MTLCVSRSQLSQRLKGPGRPRSNYHKPQDAELLVELRALVDERPTYGYRRPTAFAQSRPQRARAGHVNHKRIYRLMSLHGLLLQRYKGLDFPTDIDPVG